MERRIRAVVRGHVQGVGFRYFARDAARRLGLRGWVRNLPDGRTVEALAAGSPEAVERFLAALREGPPGAIVTGLDLEEATEGELPAEGFAIAPTPWERR